MTPVALNFTSRVLVLFFRRPGLQPLKKASGLFPEPARTASASFNLFKGATLVRF